MRVATCVYRSLLALTEEASAVIFTDFGRKFSIGLLSINHFCSTLNGRRIHSPNIEFES